MCPEVGLGTLFHTFRENDFMTHRPKTKQCSNTTCRKRFPLKRASRLYCSRSCQQDVYRRRQAVAQADSHVKADQQASLASHPDRGCPDIPVTITSPSEAQGNSHSQKGQSTKVDHKFAPWPTSGNVELVRRKLLARDGCVDPVHLRRLAELDAQMSEWPEPKGRWETGRQWREFQAAVAKILKIPCAIPRNVAEEHRQWEALEYATGSLEAAAEALRAQQTPAPKVIYRDRWGFIHRRPTAADQEPADQLPRAA